MSHRLLLHLLVSCLGIALSTPSLHAQGGGANSGGAANQVEGTGKGAGGPGDGTGPGQGAGQGLGPGGKSTTLDGSTEATANKQSSGANSGGAANQVEGTGKGAGGPGDGTGPGQGAGQGLGPGGKRPKGQPSKDKNDAHGTIGREEKPDRSHPEGKKDIKEDQGQRAKADRDRNEQSPADKKPADKKDRDRAERPSHQQDQPGNKPLKEGDHSKQKDDHSPKEHTDENKSSKDRDKPSKPGTPDRPGSNDDRNRPEKESPGKKGNEISSKETNGDKKPDDREPASRDNTPNHGEKDRNPLPRNEETPSSRPKPPAIPGDHTKPPSVPQPTPASDATTGGSPSSPAGPSLPRDNGNPPIPQPTAPPSSPQNHPAQQPTSDHGGVPHHPDQPTQPNRPSQSDHPNNPSSGGGGKDSPVSKPDGGTTPSSAATPSPNPHGGDRNPPGKPIPQPKPQSPETPGKPAQPKGPGGTPVSPVNERSLIPGPPSSLLPTAPKPASLIPGGGTLPTIPRLDSPASVGEAVVALPGSLFERIFGGHKKRTKTEKPRRTFSSGKEVIAAEKPFRTRKRGGGALFGIIKPELPNLWKAAKVQRVVIDPRITSPRTITYKSRFSRVSRWIAPLTLGIATYIPYETMNASMAARLNNLMAEEEISVEKQVTEGFAAEIAKSRRFRIANPPDAVFELEITRYALDPVPLSIGRMKPTVSVKGRLYDANGQLLWIGKGFSTILEHGIRGATVEQYEDDPEQLRRDFRASVSSAIRRLGAMATVLPRASVTVTPAQ